MQLWLLDYDCRDLSNKANKNLFDLVMQFSNNNTDVHFGVCSRGPIAKCFEIPNHNKL